MRRGGCVCRDAPRWPNATSRWVAVAKLKAAKAAIAARTEVIPETAVSLAETAVIEASEVIGGVATAGGVTGEATAAVIADIEANGVTAATAIAKRPT